MTRGMWATRSFCPSCDAIYGRLKMFHEITLSLLGASVLQVGSAVSFGFGLHSTFWPVMHDHPNDALVLLGLLDAEQT